MSDLRAYNLNLASTDRPKFSMIWLDTGLLSDASQWDTVTGVAVTTRHIFNGLVVTTPGPCARVYGRSYLNPGATADTLELLSFACRDQPAAIIETTLNLARIADFRNRVVVYARPSGSTPWFTGSAPPAGEYTLIAASDWNNSSITTTVIPDFVLDCDDVPGMKFVGTRDIGTGYLRCQLLTSGLSTDLTGLGIVLTEIVVGLEQELVTMSDFSGDEETTQYVSAMTDFRINPFPAPPAPPPPVVVVPPGDGVPGVCNGGIGCGTPVVPRASEEDCGPDNGNWEEDCGP